MLYLPGCTDHWSAIKSPRRSRFLSFFFFLAFLSFFFCLSLIFFFSFLSTHTQKKSLSPLKIRFVQQRGGRDQNKNWESRPFLCFFSMPHLFYFKFRNWVSWVTISETGCTKQPQNVIVRLSHALASLRFGTARGACSCSPNSMSMWPQW